MEMGGKGWQGLGEGICKKIEGKHTNTVKYIDGEIKMR